MKFKQHPLSAAFPAMGQGDLMLLTIDIRENGLVDPGVIYEGMILDGWHRYQACERAKVDFLATEYTGSDPVAFVVSKNAQRRNLTASQRAASIVLCHNWKKSGDNQHTKGGGEPGSPPPASNAQLAKMAGTTERTVQQAKRAVESGLGEAVRDGQMSAKTAVQIAKAAEPKAEPRAEPANDAISDDGPNLADELERQDKEMRKLEEQVAALTAEDAGAELVKQVGLRQNAEDQVAVEMDKNARNASLIDQLSKWQATVVSLVRAENPKAALQIIRNAFKVAA